MGIHRLVRFAPVDLFVGLAEGANAALHMLYEPEGHATLIPTGPRAHGALHTALGHGTVAIGNFCFVHGHLPHRGIDVPIRTAASLPATQE